MKTDPVTLEILKLRLNAVAEEMGHIIHRTGFTVFVKETWDFGCGLATPEGEVFSYPREIAVTGQVGLPLEDAIAFFPDYAPGDIVLANDPKATGGMSTHLHDLWVYKPVFVGGEILCFLWTFMHSSDIGGLVPGSIAPSAFDIFQEGFRIPPTKLYKAGVLNEEFRRLLLANTRIPHQNWGDVKALISAVNVGERRVLETVERYGLATVRQAAADLLDYGEARARAVFARIPDGTYAFSDYLEGLDGDLVRINLALRVRGSDVELDFTGTDPQIRAAFNLLTCGKERHTLVTVGLFYFLRTVDPEIPLNSGILRPVRAILPPGSLVNAEETAASGVRYATVVRVMETVLGALAQAYPGVVPATGGGQVAILLLSTIDARTGQAKVSVLQPMLGGQGGRPNRDGIDGGELCGGFLRNVPTELIEADIPILVEHYGYYTGEVSPGKHRGGFGLDFQFRVLSPQSIMTARGMERHHLRPWGRDGGGPGSLSRTILHPGTPRERSIGRIDVLHLDLGEAVRIITPCGGGLGDPLARDPEAVLADFRKGLVTPEQAEAIYGVIVRDEKVDADGTRAARARRAGEARPGAFAFGPEREAYEREWPPALLDHIARRLLPIPASLRHYMKRRLWAGRAAGTYPLVAPADVDRAIESITAELEAAYAAR